MEKIELDVINKIVNPSLKNIQEKSGMERLREIEKPKVNKEVKNKITTDADRKDANVTRERESNQSSIQSSEAKATINSLLEFLHEVSTIINEKKNTTATADRLEKILLNNLNKKKITSPAATEMKNFIQIYKETYNIQTKTNQQQDNQNEQTRN